jgi:sigma-E factor negative regulatory protein RseB
MTVGTEVRPAAGRLLALLVIVFSAPLQADQSAHRWLDAMSEAMRSLNYEGELIYQHGDSVEVLQLVHTVRNGHERERLTSLNGVPREVIRDKDTVRCILPDTRAISVDRRTGGHAFPSLQPLSADALTRVYQIQLGSHARIAGREAQGIAIVPRDGFRYAHRLHLDKQSRLPLRQVMLDEHGKRVGMIMYSRIKVDAQLPFEASAASTFSRDYTLVEHRFRQLEGQANPLHWRLGRLPPGFQVNHRELRKAVDGTLLEHLLLSDGLASVSLYVEQAQQQDQTLEGGSRMGALSAFGRRLGDQQVIAVGEVPMATVRFIVESVELMP